MRSGPGAPAGPGAQAPTSRRACSHPCATRPLPPSGGWGAGSPIAANTSGSVGLARSSPTTIPAAHSRPASRASPVCGAVPVHSTIRSAACWEPSDSITRSRRPPGATTPCAPTPVATAMPRRSRDPRTMVEASGSSWRSMSRSRWWTRVTCIPRLARPVATSIPSTPAPSTTAGRPGRAISTIRAASSRSFSGLTPAIRPAPVPSGPFRSPGTAGIRATDPVASTSRS